MFLFSQEDMLQIIGDFNGDDVQDTLIEQVYVDGNITNNHDLEGKNFEEVRAILLRHKRKIVLTDKNKILNDLIILKHPSQHSLLYLENHSDLDEEGGDELGLVVEYMNPSNINSYFVYTYDNDEWIQLLEFTIRDVHLMYETTHSYIEYVGSKKFQYFDINEEAFNEWRTFYFEK